MIYNNFNSSAVKSVEILENTVKIVYNGNTNKEYTYNVADLPEYADESGSMLPQFVSDLEKTIHAYETDQPTSMGKFINMWVREGWLYIPTDEQQPEPTPTK